MARKISKPTYTDFQEARPKELMKTYGLSSRDLEMAQRDVCYGADQMELRQQYEKFYRKNRRDV